MNNSFDFSVFTRQSTKGIIVIYLKSIYTLFKKMWIVFLPIFFGDNKSGKLKFAIILVLSVLLFFLIRSILAYLNYRFKIENEHFILKHGILRKKYVSIPFDRIQNINFNQNFIQQLINVTQVDVETAGAKSIEISIKALNKEKAIAIKNIVFSKKKEITIQTEEIKQDKPILKIPFYGLLKESITENHLKSLALLFITVFGLYSQNQDFFKKLEVFKSAGKDLETATNSTIGLFVVFLVLISIMISLGRIILVHFGLTVYYKDKVLEITQGLFTKKHQVLKKEKVQSIVISTNPLKKFFNISSVYFMQVANSKKVGRKSLPTRIIGCELEHVKTIKDFLFTNINVLNNQTYKPHKYYIIQMAVRSSLLLIIPNVMIFSSHHYYLLFINLLLIPIITFYIYNKFKKAYFVFNKDIIVVGSGQVATKTTYFEYFKLQSIQLKQTIFQKRKNIYDVILQSTTGNIILPCVNKIEANNIYNYFLYQTQISTKKWM
ncbi:MAG TPA: hypothetical protein EYP87_03130 [Flavobacteriaceae bacterium]|nr:hypothetical protein [Flavobacteriaceae bacterium]